MTDFAAWILSLVRKLFESIWDFLNDLFISLVSAVLDAISILILSIPAPSFIQGSSLQTLFNGITPDVWYFAQYFRLGECLAMFGAAISFRLLRKLVTLGQW